MYSNEEYEDEQEQSNGSFIKNFYYNNKVLIWIFIGVIVFILLMSLLTRGGSSNNPQSTGYEISIQPTDNIEISIGNSAKLIAQVKNNPNATIKWSSSNPQVATVDNGTVKAINYGKSTITAIYTHTDNKEYIATKEIVVAEGNSNLQLTDVSFKDGELLMPIGGTYSISLTLTPTNGYVTNKEFTSSNEGVVTVDNTGLVKAIGEGEATINLNVNDGLFRKSLKVYVNRDYTRAEIIVNPETIKFDGQLKKMKVGSSEKLNYTVFPIDADRTKLIWTSSDSSVATVDTNGIVRAVAEGNATITLSSITGVNATVDIEVEKDIIEATSINTVNDLYLSVGQSQVITPIINPSDASNKSLSFSASDPSIITVATNDTGTSATIIGLRAGTTTLMIQADNITKVVVVTVTDNNSGSGNNNGGGSNSGGGSSSNTQGFTIASNDANNEQYVVRSADLMNNNDATGPVTITITKTDDSIARLRVKTCQYPANDAACNTLRTDIQANITDSGSFTMNGAGQWVIRVGKYDSNNQLIGYTDKYISIKQGTGSSNCIAGQYLEGSVCTACPQGYTSLAGAKAKTQCYITVAAGKGATFTGNTHSVYTCASGYYYSSSRKVYFGSSSTCNKCDGTVNANKTTCSKANKLSSTVEVTTSQQNATTILANISSNNKGSVKNTISGNGMSISTNHQNFSISNVSPYQYGVQIKCSTPGATGTLTVKFTPSDSNYEEKTVTKSVTCPNGSTTYNCTRVRTGLSTCLGWSSATYANESALKQYVNGGNVSDNEYKACVVSGNYLDTYRCTKN